MVRILLAHEFSVLRATEETLTREVINLRGNVYHTIKSLWQDMPGGGDWHFVWAKAEEQTKKANAAGTISFAIIVARPKR
jgi:hypothetical protein